MKKITLILLFLILLSSTALSAEQTANQKNMPIMIDFGDNTAAICVNCQNPTTTPKGELQLICKDTKEANCELYFGFEKTSKQESYTEENIQYEYQLAGKDVYSATKNNFIVKSVIVDAGMNSGQNYLEMTNDRNKIMQELLDKVLATESARYTLKGSRFPKYALINEAIVTINKQTGELLKIEGASKDEQDQILTSIDILPNSEITDIPLKGELTTPLKLSERLTFRGLTGKEPYNLLAPVLEIYDHTGKGNEEWVKSLPEGVRNKEGQWFLLVCDEIIPYYAPGSKFQYGFSEQDEKPCVIPKYLLTTSTYLLTTSTNNQQGFYECGQIKYDAQAGKLTEIYCDADKSELNCRGNKNCQRSQFRLEISDKDSIELGTNKFLPDSKFEYAKKAEKPYLLELKAEEIKAGRDYIFPADSIASVLPVEADIKGMENPKGFSVLEVSTGTYMIREWASEDLIHKLMKSTDGMDVKYKVGIYEDSDDLPVRFGVVYPRDFFSYGKETPEEEKEIRSANLPDTGRVNIPTLGIEIEQFQTLDRILEGGEGFAFDIKYHAMAKEDLEKRKKQKTKTAYAGTTIDVKEMDNLYDVLTEYCTGINEYNPSRDESDEQFKIRIRAVEEMAQKMINDAMSNPESPNAEILPKKYDYRLMAKDGKLTLPIGPIAFEQDDKTQVTVIPPRCNIMTGRDKGYTIRRTLDDELKSGKQTCDKEASHKVQSGDSLRQIYDARCTDDYKKSTNAIQFKQWVLAESNNPGLAKRKAWHDKIFPGDSICIPDECDVPQVIIEETSPGKLKVSSGGKDILDVSIGKLQVTGAACPLNEFDCEEGAQKQEAYMTEEQQCEAYSESIKPCMTRCAWLTTGKDTGACVPASSTQTNALKNFKKKLSNYAKQGKKVPESISQFVEARYAPYYEEPDVKFLAAGRGPGSSSGKWTMTLGEKPEDTGIPDIDITVQPKTQGAFADYEVKRAIIPYERISCTYTKKNGEMITLTNTETPQFHVPPPQKDLKGVSRENAMITASNHYKRLIPELCKAMMQDGELKYNQNQWRVLER